MKTTELEISQLRQWLNEDRITDNDKMVSNADIKLWLGIITKFDWEEEEKGSDLAKSLKKNNG